MKPPTTPSPEATRAAEAVQDWFGHLRERNSREDMFEREKLAELIDTHFAKLRRVKEAAVPFGGIHSSTEFEAIIKLSDLRKLRAALNDLEK